MLITFLNILYLIREKLYTFAKVMKEYKEISNNEAKRSCKRNEDNSPSGIIFLLNAVFFY